MMVLWYYAGMMKGVVAVLFLVLNLALLCVAVAAAVVGLWPIAVVDLVVLLIVTVGLRAAFPVRRAVLTYREIMERQGRAVPVEPVPDEQPVEQPVLPLEQPLEQPEVAPLAGPVIAAA